MNQLIQVPLSKIKTDKNQPRQFIDEERVREMSVSIKNEGVINAIECDSDFQIITGELRFRAAKVAGLKEVPVKVLENDKAEGMPRFIRQMQENMHHNTMSALDTAKGLKKIADHLPSGKPGLKKGLKATHARELSRLFGTSHQNISDLLHLLEEPEEIQEILKTRKSFPYTALSEIRKAPEQYQNSLKKKVLSQDIPRDAVRYLSSRLKELDSEENYKFANELLKRDFSGMSTQEIVAEAGRVSTGVSFVNSDKEMVEKLEKLTNETISLLESKPMSLLEGLNQVRVRTSLTLFVGILVEYLANEQKRIEVKKILNLK